jgi:hypothetical protein
VSLVVGEIVLVSTLGLAPAVITDTVDTLMEREVKAFQRINPKKED